MFKRIAIYSSTLFFAFSILFISIFRSAAVKYTYPTSQYVKDFNTKVLGESALTNYTLAYPGRVLPDSPLWPLKAVRDKAWLFFTTNPEREAELLLLFADKRLAAGKLLFDEGNISEAYSTLSKAEKYLELASLQTIENKSMNRSAIDFDYLIASAALKHYEVIDAIVLLSPEEMKPDIIRMQDISKTVFKSAKSSLTNSGNEYPDNPFNWD